MATTQSASTSSLAAPPTGSATAHSVAIIDEDTLAIPSIKNMISANWSVVDLSQAFKTARREVIRRMNIIEQPGNYIENINLKWCNPFDGAFNNIQAMPVSVVRVLLWDIWTDLLTMIHGPCGWYIEYDGGMEEEEEVEAPRAALTTQSTSGATTRSEGGMGGPGQRVREVGAGGSGGQMRAAPGQAGQECGASGASPSRRGMPNLVEEVRNDYGMPICSETSPPGHLIETFANILPNQSAGVGYDEGMEEIDAFY